MIKLILLTGFLGTGKTTLMQHILDAYSSDNKVGVIVNEFGEVNIDSILIKKDGIQMAELSNGSIFCACIKENFLSGLIEMSKTDIEYLFIEASGLADPASMNQILHFIESRTQNQYDYKGAICIVDAETFLGLYEVLPALHNQIKYSDVVLLNKSDLVDESRLIQVSEKIASINSITDLYITSYCKVDVKEMIKNLAPIYKKPTESTNTIESRPKTFILKSECVLPYEKFVEFIDNIANATYRIKGFAQTDKGSVEVSAVGKHVKIVQWKEPVKETKLVAISSVGIKLISMITKEIEKNLKGKMHL